MHSMAEPVRVALLALLGILWMLAPTPAWADATSSIGAGDVSTGYRSPPQPLADIVDRPLTPRVLLSPDREWMLLLERQSLPSIAELAEPELRLGGLRFSPRTHGPSRQRSMAGLELVRIGDGARRAVHGLPEGARIDAVTFSPDSTHVAFSHTSRDEIELWVAEIATGEARRLSQRALNLAARVRPRWSGDGRSLICTLVPEGRGGPPRAPDVPSGPTIQQNLGATAPARTFQDLLENEHDEALFEYYLTRQLARVGLDGRVTHLGPPGVIWAYDPSPDDRYVLTQILHRPFSYLRPARWFPTRVEIWSRDGELVRQVADLPLRENIPVGYGSVATGPRSFTWRHDAPATLVWVEALDGGDAHRDAALRDQLFLLGAPFTGQPVPWVSLANRLATIYWGHDDLALVSTWWWKTRNIRVSRIRPGSPEQPAELLIDRSWEDRYNDPGTPVLTQGELGREVLLTGDDGKSIFLIGDGASPEGDRPFVDAYDLASGDTRRLFRSEAPFYERPLAVLDGAGRRILSRRESVEEPPNYFVRETATDGAPRRLTSFPHPAPELAGLQKELLRYRREDGVPLTATLYLPPGHRVDVDGPLPMLMWAYPQEFKSADAAGQVTDSPYRFDRVGWSSALLWVTQGYAVLDDPSMPIIGEADDEPNDSFRGQLVTSARAAVEECLRRGVTTADQIAIGGHSYGAFMTANLLAHSDLFAAGIARSGAYNRTLTPFGFQSEERTLWEASEVYFDMSPFMHADQLNEPILLIHGESDSNSGTFPMQSERFYNALRGHGATARLVMLPHESHGYRARESVLHMLWETHRWLETYVRQPRSAGPKVEQNLIGRGDP